MNEEKFTGRGGTQLHMRSWHSAAPRATVVVCHGVNSHSGQYLYEGHFHDLLNDVGKEAVMADVVGWIDARLA